MLTFNRPEWKPQTTELLSSQARTTPHPVIALSMPTTENMMAELEKEPPKKLTMNISTSHILVNSLEQATKKMVSW